MWIKEKFKIKLYGYDFWDVKLNLMLNFKSKIKG
jgi:hypothetical protein